MYDVFISHASEDKDFFVRPLVEKLINYGVKPWYDEFSLVAGDSLSRSIDKGLANSRFGIVILSNAFFKKKWTDFELRGLVVQEINEESKIIPIWYNINRDELRKFSPTLADKLAIISENDNLDDIVIKIIKIIRPDIFNRVNRTLKYLEIKQNSTKNTDQILNEINQKYPAIKNRKSLSDDFLLQIRLIRSVFIDVFDMPFSGWCNTFLLNENSEEELIWWYNFAAAYLEYIAIRNPEISLKKHIFKCFICIGLDLPRKDFAESFKNINSNDINKIEKLLGKNRHTVEIVETFNELNELFM